MDDSAFSNEFCGFVQSAVPSVDAAELLLFLSGDAQRWRAAAELAAQLRPATLVSDADAAPTRSTSGSPA
jgi:hypothetical protein